VIITSTSKLHEVALRRKRKNRLAKDLLEHLLLYRELNAEHDAILRHKCIESEKVGYDIGFDLAMIDWQIKHRSQWRRERHLNFQI
jgi:hypothetical protein